jgi:hypothetical protein
MAAFGRPLSGIFKSAFKNLHLLVRVYHLRPFSDGQPGGYGVVWSRPSGAHRVWVQFWRGRHVSVSSALFGRGRVLHVTPSRAVLVQSLAVRVSYSRWWLFLWLFRWLRFRLSRLG